MAAVRTNTASESGNDGPSQHPGPIRTCIGCRRRAAAAELLRVVVAQGADRAVPPVLVVPDPRHRAPGRGAWLHPDPACVELAQRRRAFGRALRVAGAIDASPVHEHVAAPVPIDLSSDGIPPRGDTSDEQAMKPQS